MGPSIWRDDEDPGRADVRPLPSHQRPQIWREDEQQGVPQGPESSSRRGDVIWGEKQGTVHRPPPPPPAVRRKVNETLLADQEIETRPRRRHRAVVALSLLLLVGLLADSAYVAARLLATLPTVGDNLQQAAASFSAGDLPNARARLQTAEEEGSEAAKVTGHPAFRLLTLIPWSRSDAEAVEAVADAAERAANAGLSAVVAAEAMGVEGGAVGESLYRDGRVDLQRVEAARPHVAVARALLDEAEAILDGAPEPTLDLVANGIGKARSEITKASGSADAGGALFEALPGLLGAQGERRYLLAFQAIGEARGTGGVVGMFGVLRARAGVLRLSEVGSVHPALSTTLPRNVDAPAWFAESYGPQFSLRQWQQVNLSPNFPAVAEVMLEQYERRVGERLDGVFAMDPVALEGLLAATGPITAGDVTLAADDVAQVLLQDQYLRFAAEAEQERFLGGLVGAFWEQVSAGNADPVALTRAVGEATGSGHLKIYSEVPAEQESLEILGVHGWVEEDDSNVQMVFHNNYGVNKVDVFLQRDVTTSVQITPTGEAKVTTDVVLRNAAPDGPPSLLLGDGSATGVGTNRMLMNLLVPEGASIDSLSVDGRKRPALIYAEEDGLQVAWEVVEVGPGGDSRLRLIYTVPNAVSFSDTRGEYFAMTLLPQALSRPDAFSLRVEAPPGFQITTTEGFGAANASEGDQATAEGFLTQKRVFVVELRPE